ncbi:anaerobic ribonucleoside-triphosphate reductase activating protein [Butyrivibrio sp. XPD2002]|jgi:anaerobic ribonucleoside-triphosphate reductase activating protein|uniref:anaerobic ribonucleoside-triphosphate reductase activating protein n=1 Tax=Butyrivibrio sp. XPD2002 TaxID=1280665 RepID=UPI00040A2FB5|nr:anaerobic ribonucleoside-triphosphate reductase activating protein [Butyrivibrio sp. XPD2002]
MNYAEIKTTDIANGVGIRTSLFVSGCTHHCKGCFNEETWDFNFGKPFTKEVEDEIIESLRPDFVKGLTILGGEPMEVVNQKALRPFIERVKNELPDKNIWIYSGYVWEELNDKNNKRCHSEDTEAILSMIDTLVDGEFVIDLKNISLKFRGSSNQRIIKVQDTLKEGKIVLSELNN